MNNKKEGMPMQPEKKKKFVPKLRFPEFLDVETWEVKQIGQISRNVTAGGTPSTSQKEYWSGSIRWMNSGELNHKKVHEVQGRITEEGLRSSSTKIIPKKCVLIGLAGQGKTRGTIAMNMVELCINQSIAAIFPNEEKFSSDFLYHNLDNRYDELRNMSAGGEGRGGLNLQIIKSLKVPFPRLNEQQKIADCLTSLDDLITLEVKKLDAIKAHKNGLMQQLFPAEGETLPKLRFPEFREAGEWTQMPLSKVCDVLQGYGFPVTLQGKTVGKYPFCKVSDISRGVAESGGVLTEAANYVDDEDLRKLRAKPIPKGATVFAKIGEALRLNRRAFVQRDCLIDNNATGLKAIDGAATDYFVYLLSQRIDLNKHCGGAVPSVNKSTLEEIEVIVPDPDEQKQIADCLGSLDNAIAVQSRKVETLKSHKKGLMQQLFPVLDEVQE